LSILLSLSYITSPKLYLKHVVMYANYQLSLRWNINLEVEDLCYFNPSDWRCVSVYDSNITSTLIIISTYIIFSKFYWCLRRIMCPGVFYRWRWWCLVSVGMFWLGGGSLWIWNGGKFEWKGWVHGYVDVLLFFGCIRNSCDVIACFALFIFHRSYD